MRDEGGSQEGGVGGVLLSSSSFCSRAIAHTVLPLTRGCALAGAYTVPPPRPSPSPPPPPPAKSVAAPKPLLPQKKLKPPPPIGRKTKLSPEPSPKPSPKASLKPSSKGSPPPSPRAPPPPTLAPAACLSSWPEAALADGLCTPGGAAYRSPGCTLYRMCTSADPAVGRPLPQICNVTRIFSSICLDLPTLPVCLE